MRTLRAVISIALLAACAGAEQYAYEGGKGGVRGVAEAIRTVDDPLLQKLRDTLTEDMHLREAIAEAAQAAARGVGRGLSEAQLDALVVSIVTASLDAAARRVDQSLAPALAANADRLRVGLRRALRQILKDTRYSLRSAVHDDLRPALKQVSAEITAVMVDTIAAALAGSLTESLQRGITQHLTPAVGELSRTAAREAVIGVMEGLRTVEDSQELARGIGVLARIVSRESAVGFREGIGPDAASWNMSLAVAATLAGIVFLLIVLFFVSLIRRYRASTRTLTVLAERINEEADPKALKRRIQEAAVKEGVETWLNDFLRRREL